MDSGPLARITLNGIERLYVIALGEDCVWVARDGHHLELRTAEVARAGGVALSGSLAAPMPGTVLLVRVADGDIVAEGDELLVLESMKMELSITAPQAGVVAGLELKPGDRVTLGQRLVSVLDPEEKSE